MFRRLLVKPQLSSSSCRILITKGLKTTATDETTSSVAQATGSGLFVCSICCTSQLLFSMCEKWKCLSEITRCILWFEVCASHDLCCRRSTFYMYMTWIIVFVIVTSFQRSRVSIIHLFCLNWVYLKLVAELPFCLFPRKSNNHLLSNLENYG